MNATFCELAEEYFSFLSGEGFDPIECSPGMACFKNKQLVVEISWENRSYEIGLRIGCGEDMYSMSEIIRLRDIEMGEQYRDHAARSEMELRHALERLAGLLRQYAREELSGSRSAFQALENERQLWSERYPIEVLSSQIRPQAEEAFRNKQYKKSKELYEKIENSLTDNENRKLTWLRNCDKEDI